MQRNPGFFSARLFGEVSGCTHNTRLGGNYANGAPDAPAFGAILAGTEHGFAGPLNGFEFQPSETCPKNFIIFDQTDNKKGAIFHPALAHKFNSLNVNVCAAHAEVEVESAGKNSNHDKCSSSLNEDTGDIDALLSSEQEEEEDVVSTGCTSCKWQGSSPDSCWSMSNLKSRRSNSASIQKSASSGACSSERKRERMRKMVKALRGIIPGGEQLDTPAILKEAVKYLKALKAEVKNLGIQNFDD